MKNPNISRSDDYDVNPDDVESDYYEERINEAEKRRVNKVSGNRLRDEREPDVWEKEESEDIDNSEYENEDLGEKSA